MTDERRCNDVGVGGDGGGCVVVGVDVVAYEERTWK